MLRDTRENQTRCPSVLQSWTGVEYCDGWETTCMSCTLYFVPLVSGPSMRQGKASRLQEGQGRAGRKWMLPLRSRQLGGIELALDRQQQGQESQSQTCATTFLTLPGGTVVSSNRPGQGVDRYLCLSCRGIGII